MILYIDLFIRVIRSNITSFTIFLILISISRILELQPEPVYSGV